MWNLNFKNETKQTKRNKQMKHKQFWVFCAMLLVLQLGFYLSVCQLASAVFAKMTCWRVLAKPRRQVHFQNTCMFVNRFDFEFVLHTTGSAQWTHGNSFLVLGMVTVLVFCREGWSVFPVLLLWKRIQTLVACWDMCYWFAKFRYVGSIWNFGKQSCWLFVLLSMHLMLVGCLIALMVFCLRPEECRECGSITSRACRTG